MRAVNLLPRDETRGGRQGRPIPALVACFGTVVATAVIAAMFLSASSKVGQQRTALEGLKAELAATPPPAPAPPQAASEGQLPQEKTQRIAALATVLSQRIVWDRVLRELSQVLPEDVWLTSLAATAPVTGTGSAFEIAGFTYSQDGVARLLSRLQVLPNLTGVNLVSSLGDKIGERPVVRFSITAAIKPPGATS
jgi:Tfp pilus assembly protein PilN